MSTSRPTTIAHHPPLITQVRPAAGTTLKQLITRLMKTIHPLGAAEGNFVRTEAGTPYGPGIP